MKYESESSIERKLRNDVKKIGGWCIKIPALHIGGIPDRLCLIPMGRLVFVELKATGKEPRPLQLHIHKKLRKLGFRVEVIDSKLGVSEFIESLDNE